MLHSTITPIANEHCDCGENPLWYSQTQEVYWADIPAGKIFAYETKTRKHRQIYQGLPSGGITIQENGSLLLFRVGDIASLSPQGEVRSMISYSDAGMKRFNDVIADPEGRVFAGTIGATKISGGVYRVDLDGKVTKVIEGTGCSNGMAFSPDLKTLYWTCTTRRTIFQYKYDRATGNVSEEKPFIVLTDKDPGLPDGLTIDSQGNFWSARWDGARIVRYRPDGTSLDHIPFPVQKVTSMCFGGPDLKTVFVTTAGGKENPTGEEGTFYMLQSDVAGRPEFKSRILI
jgi:D-xylono/L-arabinono-1,4-lactonase